MTSLSTRGLVAGVAALALSLVTLVVADPAAAATAITVTTTADTDANGACTDESVTSPAPSTSLRNALCVASNVGGESTISVPAGTYTLTQGALTLGATPGTDVTLSAAGGQAKIVGDDTFQLLTIDPALVGGIAVEIDGFAFSRGADSEFGGGAIIGGAVDAPADTLVIRDSVFTDNATTGGTGTPGGAIQFIGGDLTVVDSTFQGNSAGSSSGGAIYFEARADGDALSVDGSSFSGNSVQAAGGVAAGGGAIAFDAYAGAAGTLSVLDSVFTANTATSTDGAPARGGAIRQLHGSSQVDRTVFTGNTAGPTGGGALHIEAGTTQVRFTSLVGNTGVAAVRSDTGTTASVTDSWWGCNGGAGASGCDSVSLDGGSTSPHLTLTATASPTTVPVSGSTSVVASLRTNSAGETVAGSDLRAFDARSITWSALSPSGSTVPSSTTAFSNGQATTTFTAGSTGGVGGVTAQLDTASVPVPITVQQSVVFTSADTAAAVTGTPFSFTVSASGFPAPTVSLVSGTLPTGLAQAPSGSSVVISGTPIAPGTYPVTFSATNGGTPVQQTLTITVGSAPAFTGSLSATTPVADPVDLTITASGTPVPAITATGVPAGLTLDDNHDGTARLHGIATVGAGTYPIALTATNGVGSATGSFSLVLAAPPAITSDDSTTFTAGTAGSFPVVADAGYPVPLPPSLVLRDAPAWLSLSGAPALVGTPPAGSGGTYTFTIELQAAVTVSQTFTLTVEEPPVVTVQPLPARVLEGTDAVFSATAIGFPVPTVQWQRSDGGAWADLAGATSSTLTVPATMADDGAQVRAVFTSTAGTATSDEVALTVGQVPQFAPLDPVTALAGGALTVDVTTTGLPAGALTASGLPGWLTFADAGDGTATLTGTPALADAGEVEVAISVDNGFGTDSLTLRITVASEVPLPLLPVAVDGALSGVPSTITRGQELTIGGSGFLPGAVVRLGIYSTPTALGTAVADGAGTFTAVVTVPTTLAAGAHTVAASGISAQGTARLLAADTALSVPGPQPGTGPGSESGGLATTGLDASTSTALALLALTLLLAGLVLMRAVRRRA
ncbi:immunoglobulin domain-containing protein [Streptomyces sp. AC495_CC817]|uniref:beta strand repeat-containing protein n=1 Tax=Streptomyces sp. AC495_CC817 TaxID=2823900 RepID=UPI001C27356E|nr:immunoglobulin domain-containing protein [Streptomyces sp. AC495_CC817]